MCITKEPKECNSLRRALLCGVSSNPQCSDVIGQGFDDEGNGIAVLVETDYDNTLPSFNAAFDISDDVVLRTAYSKALVRPNLLSQSPSPRNDNGRATVRLENAKAEVLPYTSQNYDLSLAWYNRDGSAISIGMFRKDIKGKIQTDRICQALSLKNLYDL